MKKRVVAFAIRDILRMLDDTPIFFRPLLVASNTLHPTNEVAVRLMDTGDDISINSFFLSQDVSHLFRQGIYNVLIMTELSRDIDTSQASVVV